QASQHKSDHGDSYESLTDTRIPFVIFAEAPMPTDPGECPLHDPTPLQHHEPSAERAAHHLQDHQEPSEDSRRQIVAAVAAVSPQAFQPRETLLGLADDFLGSVVVLHIRGLDDQTNEQPQRIDDQVSLASLDLLAGVETFGTTDF